MKQLSLVLLVFSLFLFLGCTQVPTCGDGICDSSESCSSCEIDCNPCVVESFCGNNVCDKDESKELCPVDCFDSIEETSIIEQKKALDNFKSIFQDKMENYLAYSDTEIVNEIGLNIFEINDVNKKFEFSDLEGLFRKSVFHDDGLTPQYSTVLDYVSNSAISDFQEKTYGRYRVELNDKSPAARNALNDALLIVINRQKAEFLEISNCNEASCPDGSFYFNIDLSVLTDAEYNLIPKIIVIDTVSKEQVQVGIFKKENMRIHIPLRFFKALYESLDAVKGIQLAHSQNALYKLGFCDEGYCAPRTNALSSPLNTIWDKECPTYEDEKWIVTLDSPKAGITNYFAGGDSVGSKGLFGYGAEEICKNSIVTNSFTVDSPDNSFYVYNKDLLPETQRISVINGCGYYHLAIGAPPKVSANINDGAGQKLYCARITSVAVDIVFVDTNPAFLVKGSSQANGVKRNLYKIRISDISFDKSVLDSNGMINTSCISSAEQCVPQ